MNHPLVSVVIPAYNSKKYLAETLQSVSNQTYKNFEVVIVDDGSTDGQTEIIKLQCAADTRFRAIFQENTGVSTARNNGFNHTKGKYIAFLDADDVWLPDNLRLKIEKLETGRFGLVHSNCQVIDHHSNPVVGETMTGNEGMLLHEILKWERTQIPGPSSIVVKREVLLDVGLFDPFLSTSADHDLFIRIAARHMIGKVDQITWLYRIHPNNMHMNVDLMEHDILYLYKKASRNALFKGNGFRRKCYSAMYLILAASWAGDGRNKARGTWFVCRALLSHPIAFVNLFHRIKKQWSWA